MGAPLGISDEKMEQIRLKNLEKRKLKHSKQGKKAQKKAIVTKQIKEEIQKVEAIDVEVISSHGLVATQFDTMADKRYEAIALDVREKLLNRIKALVRTEQDLYKLTQALKELNSSINTNRALGADGGNEQARQQGLFQNTTAMILGKLGESTQNNMNIESLTIINQQQ